MQYIMNIKLISIIFFLLLRLSDTRRLSGIDLETCQTKCVLNFNCGCERPEWRTLPPVCIPIKLLCDGIADCEDGSDELECSCTEDEFQCSRRIANGNILDNFYQCIPKDRQDDEKADCLSLKDSTESDSHCTNEAIKCDGFVHCPWNTPNDEDSCSRCPADLPHQCDCWKQEDLTCKKSGFVCFQGNEKCNEVINCVDFSDELNCPCREDQFKCQCYNNNPITCETGRVGNFTGCIPISQYHDGIKQCPDGSDEIQFNNDVTCDNCNVTIQRLSNVTECGDREFPSCEKSTCFKTTSLSCSSNQCNDTEVICMSNCSATTSKQCNRGFQCADGSLGLAYQFCDGRIDCPDNSDEIRNQPGFKCVGIEPAGTCVLPQRNLYDNVAQCNDESDLCLNNSCFQCFDQHLLISSKQVCDGVFDCYDLSDECLCIQNFNDSACIELFPNNDKLTLGCDYNTDTMELFGSGSQDYDMETLNTFKTTTIICQTRWDNQFEAGLCDGKPECRDLSDECNCASPPAFCNDTCHNDYYIGDRYCDGIEDDFYKILNKSDCPKGFDEASCPRRFTCKNFNKVSIDISQVCDGERNCDDNSDETNCTTTTSYRIFSPDLELISNFALRICFWVMGGAAIVGNFFVTMSAIVLLKTIKLNQSYQYQTILLLNISLSDLIMGVYFLTISIYGVYFSGYYGQVDYDWRSSWRCSIIGSLTILSSVLSCLFMVWLSCFRFYTACKPLDVAVLSTSKRTFGIVLVWLFSLAVAVVPIFHKFVPYFSDYRLSNAFTRSPVYDTYTITNFACRLSQITNKTIDNNGTDWSSTREFLEVNFPDYAPSRDIGFYGKYSVCTPEFFVSVGDPAWEYVLAFIGLNLVSYVFVGFSYLLVCTCCKRKHAELEDGESKRMHRRVSRITVTNALCWLPICIFTILKVNDIFASDLAYVISIAVLLPINSVINPILYSPLFDKIVESCQKRKENNKNQTNENKSN